MAEHLLHIDDIVKHPDYLARKPITDGFLDLSLTREYLNEYYSYLLKHAGDIYPEIEAEVIKVKAVFAGKKLDSSPSLDTDAKKLIWGAAVCCEISESLNSSEPQRKRTEMPIWKAIAKAPDTYAYAFSQIRDVEREVRGIADLGYYMTEGDYPGVNFYYSRSPKYINTDLPWNMVFGKKMSRPGLFHEIAHAEGTLHEPESMERIRAEIVRVMESNNGRFELDEVDQVAELMTLKFELGLRHRFFDGLENNFANHQQLQLTGLKEEINMFRALLVKEEFRVKDLAGGGEEEVDTKRAATPEERTVNAVYKILDLCWYQRNGLFDDTDEQWKRMGVNFSDLIAEKNGVKLSPQEAYEILKQASIEAEETISGRDVSREKAEGRYAEVTSEASKRRAKICDDLYPIFLGPFIEEMREEYKGKVTEQIEQMLEMSEAAKSKGDQSSPGSQGAPSEGSGKGEGEGAGKGDGEGEGKGNGNGEGEGAGEGAGKGDGAGEGAGKGDGEGKGNGEGAGNGEGKGSGKGGQGKAGPSGGVTINVPGIGEIQIGDVSEAMGKGAPGGAGEAPSGKPFAKGSDVIKKAEFEARHRNDKAKREESDVKDANGKDDSGFRQGFSSGRTPPNIGDISDWNYYVSLIAPEIKQFTEMWRQLLEKQRTILPPKRSGHELFSPRPVDYDVRKGLRTWGKTVTGGDISRDDLELYHKREPSDDIATIDVFLAIDASGSMYPSPMDGVIAAAVAFYESSKDFPEINFYVQLWGNREPITLIDPKSDQEDIKERILGLQNSLGWGTQLAASMWAFNGFFAEHYVDSVKSKDARTASTHLFVLSDGEVYGPDDGVPELRVMLETNHKLTVDFAAFGQNADFMIEGARTLHSEFGERVGYQEEGIDVATAMTSIADLLNDRIDNTEIIVLPRDNATYKERLFQRTLERMERQIEAEVG